MRALSSAIAILLVGSLDGAIFHEIDTTKPLVCAFSKDQHNRIALEGGRIRKVICSEGLFSFRMDAESGQVFISAQGSIRRPALISVVTDDGVVQDLLVSLEDKAPEVVILREALSVSQPLLAGELNRDSRDSRVHILRSVRAGRVPGGYVPREPSQWQERLVRGAKLRLEPTLLLDGPYERVTALKITNRSHKAQTLSEEQLRLPGDLWIYLEAGELKGKESTIAVVASKR